MTLLSALRNGDHRFLPLLLSKIHDVLPRLVNPMLQTVPDPPANVMCDDIFDGFGNAGIGVPSQFPGYNGDGSAGFKVEHNENEFNHSNTVLPAYEKRMEDLSSPIGSGADTASNPYNSPPIIQSPMEFPGMPDFGTFPEMNTTPQQPMNNNMGIYNNNNINNFSEGLNNRAGNGMLQRPEFKRDYDHTMQLLRGNNQQARALMQNNMNVRRPPLRQNSGSSYGMLPRSVPDQNQYQQLQRMGSGHEVMGLGLGGSGDMTFR